MCDSAANSELLDAWRAGDQVAAAVLYQRYQARLLALVRSRWSRRLARRADPEDIVLSAYRSFFTAARRGTVSPTDRGDLWPLLVALTLRKLSRQARRHLAERRSVEREQPVESDWLLTTIGQSPTADEAALLAEEVEHLLARLDSQSREVAVRTLRGESPADIAAALGVHERTVRRIVARIVGQIRPLAGETLGMIPEVASATIARMAAVGPRAPLRGPLTLADIHLQQFVGAGAFSKVYRSCLRATGDTVAVKFLRKECWGDPRATDALIRESQILQTLSHPHILSLRNWGATEQGVVFLVTDFVSGGNLEEWRRCSAPTPAAIVSVVRTVAEAVAAAHERGVLHCDLKPSNVLRHADGRIVLGDFGLSRWAHDPDDVPRGGTAGFLSPEQVCDAFGPVTVQSDVYGLGGLLYALLTGRPPMIGDDLPATLAEVLSANLPVPPSHTNPDIPQALDEIVLQCLPKEPHRRFTSAHAVAEALAGVESSSS
jgi:eukaryotic-like serine/threonine-protein kinase